jgi:hypothetical protein
VRQRLAAQVGVDQPQAAEAPDAAAQAADVRHLDLRRVAGGRECDLETGDVRTNLLGWVAEPIGGDLSKPTIAPQRIYLLGAEPATDGAWMDL